jgi:hypothetical protein
VPGAADPIPQATNDSKPDVVVDCMRAAQLGLMEGDVAKCLQ